MKRRRVSLIIVLSVFAMLLTRGVAQANVPSVIRIGFPGVGAGNRPIVGGSYVATIQLGGALEEEFAKDGIKIQWSFLRGAGPAVNELFANGLLDFGFGLGDLPSIVGKAGGLNTRVLCAGGIRQNTYLAVPADSSITGVKDLRGKKVAIFKGTNLQLAMEKILEGNGLTEKDLRTVNMDVATAKAALITKDIDAAFGQYDLLALRDQGTVKILYSTKADPAYSKHSTIVATQSFIDKFPDITKRVVRVAVQTAKWVSDQEKNPTPLYQLWSKSGFPYSAFREDFDGGSVKVASSPLIDGYVKSQYKRAIEDAKRFGLIRNTIDFDSWVELKFLNEVLKELNLEHFWQEFDPSGKPSS
jgi:sulfonate transport system substrate-binding protein